MLTKMQAYREQESNNHKEVKARTSVKSEGLVSDNF